MVASRNAVMGSGYSYAGGEKNCRIEQRDFEGVKGGDPGGGPAPPELGGGCKTGMVESSEEAQEKKDFRGDEEDYPKPKALLNWGGVMALKSSFSNNVSSPLQHCEGCEEKAKG